MAGVVGIRLILQGFFRVAVQFNFFLCDFFIPLIRERLLPANKIECYKNLALAATTFPNFDSEDS